MPAINNAIERLQSLKPDKRARYLHKLATLPPTGAGYHPAILGVANMGVKLGFADEEIFEHIRENTIERGRSVDDGEIWDAIEKARGDGGNAPLRNRTVKSNLTLPCLPNTFKRRLIAVGKKYTQADLLNKSNVIIGIHPFDHALCLLDSFYAPHEYVFVGDSYGKEPFRVAEIKDFIVTNQDTSKIPHIISNPLNGELCKTKSGKESMRCDAAVKEYRFVVAEFDDMSKEEQLAFWCAIPLPIAALIDSGGKSIHAWIKLTEVYTHDEWRIVVKEQLYQQLLIPMGCDPACANPSRLSRLPGHYRTENKSWQRLLYINQQPNPKGIFAD